MMSFEKWWRNRFSSIPPLGHVLREHFNARWFRIHSLRESKRYPEEPVECEELLRRHNAVATEVLGNESECWLAVVTYTDNIVSAIAPDLPDFGGSRLEQSLVFQEPPDSRVEDDSPWVGVCWTTRVNWAPGRFDDLIRLVADDKAPQLLFAETNRSRIYAPYDGGADLILDSSSKRDALRAKYAEWLSKHPLGL